MLKLIERHSVSRNYSSTDLSVCRESGGPYDVCGQERKSPVRLESDVLHVQGREESLVFEPRFTTDPLSLSFFSFETERPFKTQMKKFLLYLFRNLFNKKF